MVERSWVVRPVPVCVVLVCGRAVLGGKAGASVCGGWRVVERTWVVRLVPVCVWCWRVVERSWVVRPVPVCVVVGMW